MAEGVCDQLSLALMPLGAVVGSALASGAAYWLLLAEGRCRWPRCACAVWLALLARFALSLVAVWLPDAPLVAAPDCALQAPYRYKLVSKLLLAAAAGVVGWPLLAARHPSFRAAALLRWAQRGLRALGCVVCAALLLQWALRVAAGFQAMERHLVSSVYVLAMLFGVEMVGILGLVYDQSRIFRRVAFGDAPPYLPLSIIVTPPPSFPRLDCAERGLHQEEKEKDKEEEGEEAAERATLIAESEAPEPHESERSWQTVAAAKRDWAITQAALALFEATLSIVYVLVHVDGLSLGTALLRLVDPLLLPSLWAAYGPWRFVAAIL